MMPRKTGVLLMNTGTPADPSVEAIRTHLAEFLSDPMLISAPPFIWKRVLKYVILPKRPERTAVMYKKMWTDEGFPFMIHSRNQRDLIEAELKARNYNDGDFEVVLAMRYGEPSIWHGLEALRKAGCERIVAVPLYPQQVRVCAGTCFKEVADRLKDMEVDRWSPELVEVPNFYRQPVYLEALAKSIADVWEYKPGSHLLLSWHSTPMADINIKGDPYRVQNFYTAQRVAHALGVPVDDWTAVYQSRFDSRRWLGPFCGQTLMELAQKGVTDVCVVCPGFVSDCLETIVEVGETLRDEYLKAAPEGSTYTFVPCLNESPGLIEAVCNAICEAEPKRAHA